MENLMKVIVLLFVFIFTSYAANNDVNKIIEKYSKVKGLEKVQNIQDFKISGKNPDGKAELEFSYYFLKPNFHRLDVKSKELNLKMTWNGKEGFAKAGVFPPQDLTDPEKIIMMTFNELVYSPIYEYQKNNYKFSLEEIVQKEGITSFRILKTDTNGIVTDLFLDTSNLNIIETIRLYDDFKEPVYCKSKFENFTDFDGSLIPRNITLEINNIPRIFKVDSVRFNIGLIPFDFRRPF